MQTDSISAACESCAWCSVSKISPRWVQRTHVRNQVQTCTNRYHQIIFRHVEICRGRATHFNGSEFVHTSFSRIWSLNLMTRSDLGQWTSVETCEYVGTPGANGWPVNRLMFKLTLEILENTRFAPEILHAFMDPRWKFPLQVGRLGSPCMVVAAALAQWRENCLFFDSGSMDKMIIWRSIQWDPKMERFKTEKDGDRFPKRSYL